MSVADNRRLGLLRGQWGRLVALGPSASDGQVGERRRIARELVAQGVDLQVAWEQYLRGQADKRAASSAIVARYRDQVDRGLGISDSERTAMLKHERILAEDVPDPDRLRQALDVDGSELIRPVSAAASPGKPGRGAMVTIAFSAAGIVVASVVIATVRAGWDWWKSRQDDAAPGAPATPDIIANNGGGNGAVLPFTRFL